MAGRRRILERPVVYPLTVERTVVERLVARYGPRGVSAALRDAIRAGRPVLVGPLIRGTGRQVGYVLDASDLETVRATALKLRRTERDVVRGHLRWLASEHARKLHGEAGNA